MKNNNQKGKKMASKNNKTIEELTEVQIRKQERLNKMKKLIKEQEEEVRQISEQITFQELTQYGEIYKDYVIKFNVVSVNASQVLDTVLKQLQNGQAVQVAGVSFIPKAVGDRDEELINGNDKEDREESEERYFEKAH